MARIPEPIPGLIFRYGYLWLEEHQTGRVDPSKDRPACILLRVVSGAKLGRLRVEGTSIIAPDDVIILPITTQRPRRGTFAVELSAAEKRICRLDPEVASWLIVSEFNADSWPNADLALIPAVNEFDYGIASPGLMNRIWRRLAEAAEAGAVIGVKRYGP